MMMKILLIASSLIMVAATTASANYLALDIINDGNKAAVTIPELSKILLRGRGAGGERLDMDCYAKCSSHLDCCYSQTRCGNSGWCEWCPAEHGSCGARDPCCPGWYCHHYGYDIAKLFGTCEKA